MAGLGTRFANAGYTLPKPFIDVNGAYMVVRAIESLGIDGNYIFIGQRDHLNDISKIKHIIDAFPNSECNFIGIDSVTDGAAVTVLSSKEIINNDTPLIIANSDQIVEWNAKTFIDSLNNAKNDGVIALFPNDDPKWSYAEITNNKVTRVAEKEVISQNASVGIYGWKRGSDYIKYAIQMINKNITTNGEYYICPVYNEAIQDGKTIAPMFVDKMHGLGTPEDLNLYLGK